MTVTRSARPSTPSSGSSRGARIPRRRPCSARSRPTSPTRARPSQGPPSLGAAILRRSPSSSGGSPRERGGRSPFWRLRHPAPPHARWRRASRIRRPPEPSSPRSRAGSRTWASSARIRSRRRSWGSRRRSRRRRPRGASAPCSGAASPCGSPAAPRAGSPSRCSPGSNAGTPIRCSTERNRPTWTSTPTSVAVSSRSSARRTRRAPTASSAVGPQARSPPCARSPAASC